MATSELKGVPPWFSGPKPHYRPEVWTVFVSRVLLGTPLEPTAKTAKTESGLGIKTSRYWFIGRADASRGQFLFRWRATVDDWPAEELGVTPFDTGGLFTGELSTKLKLSETEIRKVFSNYSKPLKGWLGEFAHHLSQHYDSPVNYIGGKIIPRPGLPEIDYEKALQKQDCALAWTWEACVDRDIFHHYVRLTALLFNDDDADYYEKWLLREDNPYHVDKREELQVRFETLLRRHPLTKELTTAVNHDLMKESEEGFSA